MFKVISKGIANVPTPMAGLALAIASLGWCWENVVPTQGAMQSYSAALAATLIALISLKFLFHTRLLIEELKHPVVGSVVPTYAMALMVISNSLAKGNVALAEFVWLFAIALHVLFLLCFIFHRIVDFKLEHMVPSWFIPPIGLIVADVSYAGNVELMFIANALFYFGLTIYAVMLPVMLYRLIFCEEITDAAKPTIAVLAAPASLSLAGYLTISTSPSPVIVAVLLGIAVLMTFVIYVALQKLLRLPFSPAYAAFTFPLVISATALFKASTWMKDIGIDIHYVIQIQTLATIELVVATFIVSYVSAHYVRYFSVSI